MMQLRTRGATRATVLPVSIIGQLAPRSLWLPGDEVWPDIKILQRPPEAARKLSHSAGQAGFAGGTVLIALSSLAARNSAPALSCSCALVVSICCFAAIVARNGALSPPLRCSVTRYFLAELRSVGFELADSCRECAPDKLRRHLDDTGSVEFHWMGCAITAVSIFLIGYLITRVPTEYLFPALATGPVLGLISAMAFCVYLQGNFYKALGDIP